MQRRRTLEQDLAGILLAQAAIVVRLPGTESAERNVAAIEDGDASGQFFVTGEHRVPIECECCAQLFGHVELDLDG